MTDRMCQKQFVKFRARGFSLDDALPLGRSVEIDSNQNKTLIENSQCYTTQEIANVLKISKSIMLLVKMKNMSFTSWKKSYILANPVVDGKEGKIYCKNNGS